MLRREEVAVGSVSGKSVRVCAPRLSRRCGGGLGDQQGDQGGVGIFGAGRELLDGFRDAGGVARDAEMGGAEFADFAQMRRAGCVRAWRVSGFQAGRGAAGDCLGGHAAGYQGFEDGIAGKAVGAVQAGGGCFPAGEQAAHGAFARARPPRCRPYGNARPGGSGSAGVAGSMPFSRQTAENAGEFFRCYAPCVQEHLIALTHIGQRRRGRRCRARRGPGRS